MPSTIDPRDVVLGLAVVGAEVGAAAGRAALATTRLAASAPIVGPLSRRAAADLEHQGQLARARLDARVDELTRAVAHVLAERHVVDLVAAEVIAATDLDAVVESVLEHERMKEALERVLASPELERIVDYVATSPQILDVVTRQTQSLAGEMADGVRARAQSIDDVAERTVRGWLRRPRPQMT